MKYMLLIHSNPDAVAGRSEEETLEVYAYIDDLHAQLSESGELVGGEALAHVSHTKVVRASNGVPVTTDGPFVEVKEQFAGYLIVDVDSVDRAVEIAANWPDASDGGAMEVRPIMDPGGTLG
jgi:hypothetical protein